MSFLHRAGYRAAFRTLRIWWRIRRPRARGAAVAIWRDDALLLVRTSYRPELDLPGGGIDLGEAPVAAAVRELREETGLQATPLELVALGDFRFEDHHRQITAHLFAWWPTAPIEPSVDRREILWAGFVPRAQLDKVDLAKLPRLYLEALRRQVPSGTRQISRA
jgi:8-oxo-dGTP diphosphatase